jgi:hypothetical protein
MILYWLIYSSYYAPHNNILDHNSVALGYVFSEFSILNCPCQYCYIYEVSLDTRQ